jgi:hypothetical protein
MPRVIVERTFDPPLTVQELEATERRMAPCRELYGVEWICSFWSSDRRRMICEYEAADAESVRAVQREARAIFDRIWTAEPLVPTPQPAGPQGGDRATAAAPRRG